LNYYQLIFKGEFNETFNENKTYIFKSELELKKGDYVVAMTRYGYAIAVVFEKNNVNQNFNYLSESVASIVLKLEGNYYDEKEAAEQLKRIERTLDQKSKNISKIIQYETIAKYDSDAKELLDKYKELKNGKMLLLDNTSYEDDNMPF
jgi:hypothetical protein